MTFKSEVKTAIANSKKAAERHVRGTLLGIYVRTIRRTPVDEGRLRNNWFTSIGAPTNGIRGLSSGGSGSIGQSNRMVKKIRLGDTIYFTNNLPYAVPIERGSSTQAPTGMLRISIREAL